MQYITNHPYVVVNEIHLFETVLCCYSGTKHYWTKNHKAERYIAVDLMRNKSFGRLGECIC